MKMERRANHTTKIHENLSVTIVESLGIVPIHVQGKAKFQGKNRQSTKDYKWFRNKTKTRKSQITERTETKVETKEIMIIIAETHDTMKTESHGKCFNIRQQAITNRIK